MHPIRPIKSVIIDDEIKAVRLLEEMLKDIEGIEVVGYALNVTDGLNIILQHRPDMVFLDIKMRGSTGFDLIKELQNYDHEPAIVMVSGFDHYGIEAVKAGAFDYVLKPPDPKELLKVVSRYNQNVSKRHLPASAKKIRFNTLKGFILINPEEILYCKAEANYTDIYLITKHKHTISLNIGSIEKILAPPVFFRISRSVIINLKYLTEIKKGSKTCILSSQHELIPLAIARDKIKELEDTFLQ
ncbi:MAG: LytTR family DNA-binding domain-containing protein [Bacteroidales bacterium]|nr:LytTR family DNA-binding domain-containing protein [Bacteroidales bacterium]